MKKILELNPELAKNIWLEFSPQRMILMPVVIGLSTLSIVTNSDSIEDAAATIHSLAAVAFIIITMLAGIRSASRSLSSEQTGETWDWQRMSGIGAWKLATGKLFGGTAYNWYGGLICLIIYIATAVTATDPALEILTALILIILSIGIHGVAMLATVPFMNQAGGKVRLRTFLIYSILITAAVTIFSGYSSREAAVAPLSWYGMEISVPGIVLLLVTFYTTWVVAGLYRTMRAELQFTDPPNWWLLFLTTNLIFEFGFIISIPELQMGDSVLFTLLLVMVQYLGFTYITALSDNKDVIGWRKLLNEAEPRFIFRQLPLWTVSMGFSLICLAFFIVLFLIFPLSESATSQIVKLTQGNPAHLIPLMVSVFAFVFRDIGIMLLLSFSDRRRAPGTFVLVLFILYGLMPGVVREAGVNMIFFPDPNADPMLMLAFPLVEALIVFMLVRRKWNQSQAVTT